MLFAIIAFVSAAAPAAAGPADAGPADAGRVAARPADANEALGDGRFTITREMIERLPLPRDIASYALLAPGTVASSFDAAALAQAIDTSSSSLRLALPSLSIHGGRASDTALRIDGVDVGDPASALMVTRVPVAAVESLRVGKGAVDVATRSGSDAVAVDAGVFWRPRELGNGDDALAASLAAGGPIIKQRLWFFGAAEVESATGVQQPASQIFPQAQTPAPNATRFLGFGKLTWLPIPTEKLSLMLTGDPASATNVLQDISVHPKAEQQEAEAASAMALSSATTLFDDGASQLLWHNTLSYVSRRSLVFPQSGDLDTPAHENLVTGTRTVNDGVIRDDKRGRFALVSELDWHVRDFFGEHRVLAGGGASLAWEQLITSVPGDRIFVDSGITRATSSIDGTGDPFQVIEIDPQRVDADVAGAGVWAGDEWRPLHNLSLSGSLRFDATDASAAGADVFAFQTLSPRVGVAWDPFDDDKTVLRAHYAFIGDDGAHEGLAIARFSVTGRNELHGDTFEFDPVTEDYTRHIAGDTATATRVTHARHLDAPFTQEARAGVARELVANAVLSVDATWRKRERLFVAQETNVVWSPQGQAIAFVDGDPHETYDIQTQAGAFAEYAGVDVAIAKRFSEGWQVLATYTLSSSTGTKSADALLGVADGNPLQKALGAGALADDVRHQLSVAASIDLPLGFGVGTRTAWRSGRSASKLFLDPFDGGFDDLRAPRGIDPKNLDTARDDVELRLPDALTIDLRAQWNLRELTGVDVAVVADVFNALSTQPVTAIEERDLPAGSATAFGDALAVAPPFHAQLAIEYRL